MTQRLENLIGALGLAVSDRMAGAFEGVCDLSDSAPAALILIHFNPDTRIEALAQGPAAADAEGYAFTIAFHRARFAAAAPRPPRGAREVAAKRRPLRRRPA